MENAKTTNNLSFKERKGFFVQKWVLVAALALAALCIIVVGLMVGYLVPCAPGSDSSSDEPAPIVKELPYVRLPRSVVPEHYTLELKPYIIVDNFTFEGSVSIQIRVLEPTDNITLHIHNITVKESSVQLRGENAPKIRTLGEEKEKQFFILFLERNVEKGVYQVDLEYLGSLNDQLVGFYRSAYDAPDGQKRYLATTQFQPTDARRAFPCFDEPAMKAKFNITIVRPANMTSLSNMPRYRSQDRGDGWVADYYMETVKMSTYLLAFIVSDYQNKSANEIIEFSVWSREAVVETTQYALDIGPRILNFYNGFFNEPYPLPKMDMVAIPDFSAGAMENWGLITYRETALLYDQSFSSASNKQRIATIVSHEIAHQWFGNLVTPAWWDDLWLNEGFASYVEYLGVNDVHPEWQMDQQFVLDDLQDVMDLDCLKTSHPISLPVRHPDEINEIFDRISYGKGASIIRMMKFFLGDDNFRKGLSNYLKAMKFGNAVQDDLWRYLTDVQNENDRINVKTVMDSWTLQTGYPVVKVIRNYSSGTATITQNRFLLEKGNTTDTSSWEIPFTYTDGLNPSWDTKTKVWMHKSNESIKGLPSQWIIGNIQEVGYYKVNYDDHNWRLLIQQFQDDHTKIHITNRAQILDDSLDLARAGDLNYHLALNTTLYLKNEKDYLPWKAALHSFAFIDSMICRSSLYGKWKGYLVKQLTPLYEEIGWDEQPNENILRIFTRSTALSWMCNLGHKDCISEAQKKYDQWKQDPQNVNLISPNLRQIVLCVAVQYGGQEVWDFIWQQYKLTQIASQKDKFMSALACAREPWLLTRYLNMSITADSGIRRQDGSYVFRSVGSKLYGRDLTFNYLRDKWDAVFERYGKSFFAISGMVKSVTSSLNTRFELNQLKEFYTKYQNNLGTAKRAFEQSLENAEANVKWMETNYNDVADWLEAVIKEP